MSGAWQALVGRRHRDLARSGRDRRPAAARQLAAAALPRPRRRRARPARPVDRHPGPRAAAPDRSGPVPGRPPAARRRHRRLRRRRPSCPPSRCCSGTRGRSRRSASPSSTAPSTPSAAPSSRSPATARASPSRTPASRPLFDLLDQLGLERVPVDARPARHAARRARGRRSTPGPRVVVLQPRAHNPTGVSMTSTRARELAAVLRRHDALVVEDDHSGEIASARDVSLGRAPARPRRARPLLLQVARPRPAHRRRRRTGLRARRAGRPPHARPRLDQPAAAARARRPAHRQQPPSRPSPTPAASTTPAAEPCATRCATHGIAIDPGDGINLWLPVHDERTALVRLEAAGHPRRARAPRSPPTARPATTSASRSASLGSEVDDVGRAARARRGAVIDDTCPDADLGRPTLCAEPDRSRSRSRRPAVGPALGRTSRHRRSRSDALRRRRRGPEPRVRGPPVHGHRPGDAGHVLVVPKRTCRPWRTWTTTSRRDVRRRPGGRRGVAEVAAAQRGRQPLLRRRRGASRRSSTRTCTSSPLRRRRLPDQRALGLEPGTGELDRQRRRSAQHSDLRGRGIAGAHLPTRHPPGLLCARNPTSCGRVAPPGPGRPSGGATCTPPPRASDVLARPRTAAPGALIPMPRIRPVLALAAVAARRSSACSAAEHPGGGRRPRPRRAPRSPRSRSTTAAPRSRSTAPPTKVVTIKSTATEMLLALGLQDVHHRHGVRGRPGPGRSTRPRTTAIPVVSDKVPGQEALLGARAGLRLRRLGVQLLGRRRRRPRGPARPRDRRRTSPPRRARRRATCPTR